MKLVVLEPTDRVRRVASSSGLCHLGRRKISQGESMGLAAQGPVLGASDTGEQVRRRHEGVVADPWRFANELASRLSGEGLQVEFASNGLEAAEAVNRFASSTRLICNKSAAVREIQRDLDAVGLTVDRDYPGRDLPESEQILSHGWQLPKEPAMFGMGAFQDHLPRPRADGRNLKSLNALMGVSSAGADGSFFWVQHFGNIVRALDQADHLILLVPIDKVVASAEEARIRAELSAASGWAARILDSPSGKADTGAGRLWEAAGPGEKSRKILVLLLDNGRSSWASAEQEQLLHCLSCRACRQNCPTQEYFAGEQEMSPVEYLRFYHQGIHRDISLCVGCGNCLESCPVDIDVPGLMVRARTKAPISHPIRDFAVKNPELLGRMGRMVLKGTSGGRPAGAAAQLVAGIHRDVKMPPYAKQAFGSWWEKHETAPGDRKVVFYPGCFVNYHDLEQGIASVRLLEATGHEVIAPRTRCCEIAKLQAGDWEGARRAAERNVAVLEKAAKDADAIVTGCPSCARALIDFYPELLGEPGAQLAGKVDELFHFLAGAGLGTEELSQERVSEPQTLSDSPALEVLYHTPCHYPSVDSDRTVINILTGFGVEVEEIDRGCCCMSGSFGLKARYHDLSMEIGKELFTRVLGGGEDRLVATNCGACQLQIKQGTGRKVVHPAAIIEKLLRGGKG